VGEPRARSGGDGGGGPARSPEISQARAVPVTAIVEPTTLGVGRRADVLAAVSEATGMPLVAPTGVYREPWIPPWVRHAAPRSCAIG
jgi:phosphotriesterase-related protein